MSAPDLLFGPYQPPPLRRGDRAFCLLRDTDVVITSWSDARISWPRCRALQSRGGSGLLMDEELARAVRHESALAIRYWWGVGVAAVWHWRRSLSVGRMDNEGSRRLMLAACQAGADALKNNGLPDEVCKRASERAKRLNLIRFARRKPPRPLWTKGQLRLLGTAPDATIAERIGRTTGAVRQRRTMLGIPTYRDRRQRQPAGS